jgi:hypothetical protein
MDHPSFSYEGHGFLFQLSAWEDHTFRGEWRTTDDSIMFYGVFRSSDDDEVTFTITHIGNIQEEVGRKLGRVIRLKCNYNTNDGDLLSTSTPEEDWDVLPSILKQLPVAGSPHRKRAVSREFLSATTPGWFLAQCNK